MAGDGDTFIGRVLAGRYAVTEHIGSGGMSTVYRADDAQLGRAVAIKLFNPGEARDDERRRSEVDVLARLNHPNLVTMYDAHLAAGDERTPSFLVMEFVNGPDLRTTLDHGPLLGAIAAQITIDIAEGLAAMHEAGIVHRDLKPANILLAPTGLPSPKYRAKLADFGIAHLVGADRLTAAGTIIGTAGYLSPEQASGVMPGPDGDVYALGLVILEGLTGRREYPGSVVEAMSARASRDPVIDPSLPPSWVSLLGRMTARQPEDRPSALDVAVRARDIAFELAAWQGADPALGAAQAATPAAAQAATAADTQAATLAATQRMPVEAPPATLRMPVEAPPATLRMPVEPPSAADRTPPTTHTELLAPATPSTTPAPRPSRARRWALLTTAAVALVVAAVWGAMTLSAAPTAEPAQPQPVATQPGGTPPDATQTGDTQPSDPQPPATSAQTAAPVDTTPAPGATPGVPTPTDEPAVTPSPSATVEPAPVTTAPGPPGPGATPPANPAPPGNNGNGNGNGSGNGNGNGRGNGKG